MPHNRIAATLSGTAPASTSTDTSAAPPIQRNGDQDTHVGMNVVLQQAEATKTSLRDAFSQINRLIGSLKRHRRQSKLVQTTLASLKQLQTLDV